MSRQDAPKKKIKRTPNWKFWVLLISVIVLIGVLVFTFFFYGVSEWLLTMLLPLTLGTFASVIVSIYFTIKAEKDSLYREVLNELDELFDYGFLLLNQIDLVMCSSSYPLLSKKRIMINGVMRKPRLFHIARLYTEYWDYYDQAQKKILKSLEKIEPKEGQVFLPNDNPVFLEYIFQIHEMTDKSLKLQEQILQDFKTIPKGPIPDQLIFKIKSTQEQKSD